MRYKKCVTFSFGSFNISRTPCLDPRTDFIYFLVHIEIIDLGEIIAWYVI